MLHRLRRILLRFAIGAIAALPIIAENMPLELSRLVLADGRRQIEMQGMAHLASPAFFREVAAHVTARREQGWLVFYEFCIR